MKSIATLAAILPAAVLASSSTHLRPVHNHNHKYDGLGLGKSPTCDNASNSCSNVDISTCGLSECVGEITGMHLLNKSLTGDMPDFGPFGTSLTGNIVLQDNNLAGSIPKGTCLLQALDVLDLGNNDLGGTIPACVDNMVDLVSLSLYGNGLSGAIPPSLGSVAYLEGVYLDQNKLTSTIPPSLGSLNQLSHLRLWQNQIVGSIPSSIGSLSLLQTLIADQNHIGGTLPPSIGSLSSLTYLAVYDNDMTGSIPTSVGQLTQLQSLFLSGNSFSGDLPLELCPVLEGVNNCTAGTFESCPAQCADVVTTKCKGTCSTLTCNYNCDNYNDASCWNGYNCGSYQCTKIEVDEQEIQCGGPADDPDCTTWVAPADYELVVLKAGPDKPNFVTNAVYTGVSTGEILRTAENGGTYREIVHVITCVAAPSE